MRLPRPIRRLSTSIAQALRRPDFTEQGKATGYLYKSDAARFPLVTDDLLDRKGSADIYREMRHDPELKAALTILAGGILARGWEIHPAVKEGDEGYEVAETQARMVETAFNDMPGSLDDVVEEIIRDFICYGTSITERNWQLASDGEFAGLITYASLKPKDPTLYYLNLDEFNNIRSMELRAGGTPVTVDVNKFALFANRPEHGQPWGTSEFRAAYRWYWLKNNLTKWWAVYLEKYGTPTAKGTVPKGTPKTIKDELLTVLGSIQQQTSLVVESGQEVELLTADVTAGNGGYPEAIAYCDKQMVKALLGQTLTTDEGDRVGSMALGKVHADTLGIIVQRLQRKVEEFMDEQMVRPLCDYNYAEPLYPNFVLPLQEKDVTALSEQIFRLISCEAVDPRESWIREYLGLPAREELPDEPTPETQPNEQQDEQQEQTDNRPEPEQ